MGCYNRIIPPEEMICCRRWGLPTSVTRMITIILNNTVYKLRTGHGISTRSYVEKGSSASPAIWMAVLDPILWSLAEKFQGFKLESPSGIQINRIGDAYVDDVVLTLTHPDETLSNKKQIETLPALMEAFLQDFERKLYTTGGELSLAKTFWYMIALVHKDTGEARMATKEEAPGEIYLTEGKGQEKTQIRRYECDEAQRTLGARIAPSGTMDKEVKYRTDQCNAWAHAMSECTLTKRDAYKAYHNVLIPRISYPMGATTISAKDLKQMQVIVDKLYLPSVGLNRHFPLEMLNGPAEYGGLEHKTFQDRQGIAQIKLHIGSIRNDVDTAQLIKASQEITQLESGLGTPIMSKVTKRPFQNWTENTINHSIKEYMSSFDAEIRYTEGWTPTKQRKGDKFLMEELHDKYKTDKRLLAQLNRCRMTIQAITLSDITDSKGEIISPQQLEGQRPQERRSTITWPSVGPIKKKYWKEWKNCIQETFCHRGTRNLRQKLGKWNKTNSQEWDTYIFRRTKTLIWRKRENGKETWYDHGQPVGNSMTYNVNKGTEIEQPTRAVRVTLKSSSAQSWVFHQGSQNSAITRNQKRNPKCNHAEICNRLTGKMKIKGRMAELARSLRRGTLIGGSDASVKAGEGTTAWEINTPQDINTKMYGEGPVDGDPNTMHSTRAERGATVGCLWAITKLAKKYTLKEGECTLHIDNQGSYKQGHIPEKGEGPYRHLTDDYDYKCIRTMLERELKITHNITINYQWVQGHQDKKPIRDKEGLPVPLTRAAKINIACDKRAGDYRKNPETDRKPGKNPTFPTAAKVYFVAQNQVNTGNLENQIMTLRHGQKLRKKLQQKFDWTGDTFDKIYWRYNGEAVRKTYKPKDIKIAKSIFG